MKTAVALAAIDFAVAGMSAPLEPRLVPPPPTSNADGSWSQPTHHIGPNGRIPGVPNIEAVDTVEGAAAAEVTEVPANAEIFWPPYQKSDGTWTTPKEHHPLGLQVPKPTPPAAIRPRYKPYEDVDRVGWPQPEPHLPYPNPGLKGHADSETTWEEEIRRFHKENEAKVAAEKAKEANGNVIKKLTNEPRDEPAVDAPVDAPVGTPAADADNDIVAKYNPFSKGDGHGPVKTQWHWPGIPKPQTPGLLPPILAPPTAYPNGKGKPGFVDAAAEAPVETGAVPAPPPAQASPTQVAAVYRRFVAAPPAYKVHEEAAAAAALSAFADKVNENAAQDVATAPLVTRQDDGGGASVDSIGSDDHKKKPRIPGTHDTVPPWMEGSHTHTHHIPHSVGPGGKSTDPNGPGTGPMDAVVETDTESAVEADVETRAKLEPREEKPWPKHGGHGPANPPGHNGAEDDTVEAEAKPWPKHGGHGPADPPEDYDGPVISPPEHKHGWHWAAETNNEVANADVEARAVEVTDIKTDPAGGSDDGFHKPPTDPFGFDHKFPPHAPAHHPDNGNRNAFVAAATAAALDVTAAVEDKDRNSKIPPWAWGPPKHSIHAEPKFSEVIEVPVETAKVEKRIDDAGSGGGNGGDKNKNGAATTPAPTQTDIAHHHHHHHGHHWIIIGGHSVDTMGGVETMGNPFDSDDNARHEKTLEAESN